MKPPLITVTQQDAYLMHLHFDDGSMDVFYAVSTLQHASNVAIGWVKNIHPSNGSLDYQFYGWTRDGKEWTARVGLEGAERCPRCREWIPNNDNPGLYPGALSRRGTYYVCSACGQREAFEDLSSAMEGNS